MDELVLNRPGTCFVQPINLSGMTDYGIYVFDHDSAKDLSGTFISLMVRVLEKHPTCTLESGKVYIIDNIYNFSPITRDDVTHYIMHESNFLAEVEGYDDESGRVAEELESDKYRICARA